MLVRETKPRKYSVMPRKGGWSPPYPATEKWNNLPFCGINKYLRGLVSVYEHPIITGVRILIVYSTTV